MKTKPFALLVVAPFAFLTHKAAAQDIPPSPPTEQPQPAPTDGTPSQAPTEAEPEPDAESQEPEAELVERMSVGSKATERAQVSPAVVTVITADQIAGRGYRSVGEALQDVPGLYVSNDLQNMHVAVRGLSGGARGDSRYLKIMIDGRPFAFGFTQGYFLGPEFIPISAVERIEIMKGPASALYGAGALNGAINVVTRRPPYEGELSGTTRGIATGAVGSRRVAGVDVTQTLLTRDMFVLLAVQHSYENRSGLAPSADSPFLARDASGQLPARYRSTATPNQIKKSANDVAQPTSLLGKVQLELGGGRADLTLVGQLHDSQAEFHDLSVLTRGTRVNLYNWMANASYERPFENGFTIVGGAGYGAGGVRSGDQFDLGPQNSFILKRKFFYGEGNAFVEGKYEFGEGGRVLAGVDGIVGTVEPQSYVEVSRANNAETPRAVPRTEGVSNVAGYGQVVYPLGKTVRLVGGVRYDHHNVYGGALGARGGVVLPVTSTLTFKLLGGRSYKGPSPEQLFGVAMNPLDVQGDRTLKPQYMTGGDAVVDWFFAKWGNVNLTGFASSYTDTIAYINQGGNLRPVPFDAKSYGGELTVRFAKDLGDYGVSVAPYGSVAVVDAPIQRTAFTITQVIPDNEATPVVMSGLRARVRLDPLWLRPFVLYRFGSKRNPTQSNLVANQTPDTINPAYRLDAYHIIDAGVTTPPIPLGGAFKLEGVLKATNLFDVSYGEIGYNGVDVPSLGRTAWLQARVIVD